MTYPSVLDEASTLAAVVKGRSIARYGDGEFKLCAGHSIKSQPHHPQLEARLREILVTGATSSDAHVVGIPNIRSNTPKAEFWGPFMAYGRFLGSRPYASSFITRPDSAPWIDTDAYWTALESLWLGQDVTLVRGSTKSLTAEDLMGAGTVTEIVAPRHGAWAEYGALLKKIGRPTRALLCLGPTATVMAVDLAARGVHAIDLGHIGMFLRKRRRGEPMWVSKADKAAEG